MNKEQDYASDTDESDEDFRPDNLAGEDASEDDGSEDNEEETEGTGESIGKLKKRKKVTKKSNKKKTKDESESDDDGLHNSRDDLQTTRRATGQTEDLHRNDKGKT